MQRRIYHSCSSKPNTLQKLHVVEFEENWEKNERNTHKKSFLWLRDYLFKSFTKKSNAQNYPIQPKFYLTGSGCITGAGFLAFKNPGFGGRAGAGGGHWTEGK